MPAFRPNYSALSPNVALSRLTLPFRSKNMFSRAVTNHSSSHRPKTQQPLNLNQSVTNLQKKEQNVGAKRKFDRTMSSTSNLSQLHTQFSFNENDFEDDSAIDLTMSPPRKNEVQYPSLDPVTYPSLPSVPQPSRSQKTPSSSVPVPWSSSPIEHHMKPIPKTVKETIVLEEEERPKKKRALPQNWAKSEVASSTPLPKDKSNGEKYFWNNSASAVKDQAKELRKKNSAALAHSSKIADIKRPASAGSDSAKLPATHLSEEQRDIAKAVVQEGKSVFFTGSAGTGKSVLMKAIIRQLRAKFAKSPEYLAITASTGLAACVIEGTTLHSWAGIGLGKEPAPELVKKIKRNAKTRTKWLRTKVLIVDEISMVDGDLFDKLEQIARIIRNNGRPFGGIQLVVTGDFFQLPPVPERDRAVKFAFDAATWNTCIEHTILLTHVFRQKDPVFANMLNEMRLGKLSPTSTNEFRKLSRPLTFVDDVDATELFPTRHEVESANNSRMQRLSGQAMTFEATDSGVADMNVREKILANFMAPEKLTLKKGAQVMLIKNLDHQLANGTLGKVVSFMDEATFATYKGNEETYHTAYRDGADDDEESKAARIKFNMERFKNKEPGTVSRFWPMVRFRFADGTSRDMLCQPEEWKTETQQGEITAKRIQVPLILAWALSIHKAQGQTLSRVKVDLGKVFERGQAYVALSRATSQAGLQVLRFDPRKVMVHPKVVQFYEKLVSIDTVMAKNGTKKNTATSGGNSNEAIDVDDDEELYMFA